MGKIKIWIAKNTHTGSELKKRNLKELCEEIGLSYNTAKKRLKALRDEKMDDKFRWAGESVIYDIWREEI